MKTKLKGQVTLALILIALGVFFYYVHFLVFRDVEHILSFFIGDVAFVFFEVLLVTLIIHSSYTTGSRRLSRTKYTC